jgi:molybdopterin-synthase adenylyltransferase
MDLSRQSFLGPGSDELLASTRVGIVGLGGGGSHIAQQLAHIGIGNFILIDHDRIEASNLNRLVGATAKDVKHKTLKVKIISKRIMAINPAVRIKTIPSRWQEGNAANFLRDCDAIFGCVDSFSARRDLEAAARRYLIPYIDIGMDVHQLSKHEFSISGQVVVSMPGQLCLRCLGFLTDERINTEAQNYGSAGGKPQVVWPNGILASLAVGTFMQLLTPWHNVRQPVVYLEYDGNLSEVKMNSRLPDLQQKKCTHFDSVNSIGDPFFRLPIEKGKDHWTRFVKRLTSVVQKAS